MEDDVIEEGKGEPTEAIQTEGVESESPEVLEATEPAVEYDSSAGIAINELIVRVHFAMKEARAKLEVEESGRVVASLQGKLAGYRTLIDIIAAEFHLTQFALDDSGDNPIVLPDMDEKTFEALRHDVETLRISVPWKSLEARVDGNAEIYKNYLLFSAEKTRDLDLKQGQYNGQIIFREFFSAVEAEDQRRRNEAERKAKEKAESLDFGDGDEPGQTAEEQEEESVVYEEADEAEGDLDSMENLDPLADNILQFPAQADQ